MSSVVLVHGAWQGGWCWRRVARRLRTAGHEVYTPTLTGLGERSQLISRDIDLDTHVEDVLAVLRWEGLKDVVLCGHSYAGMVISGVADRCPDSIGALVYIDAFVPRDGDSMLSLNAPEFSDKVRALAREQGEGWRIPPLSAEDLGIMDRADWAWFDRLCVDHPLACWDQPLRLGGDWRRVARKAYVVATKYDPTPFAGQANALRDQPDWTVHRLDCGHQVMIDMPDELAGLLLTQVLD